jgi:Domain of unknown function (DUF4351)
LQGREHLIFQGLFEPLPEAFNGVQLGTEVLALSPDDNRRSQVLQLLTNWRVSLQLQDPLETEEQELMATLSQAYLDWERQTEQRGSLQEARSLVLRLLTHRLGELPPTCMPKLKP